MNKNVRLLITFIYLICLLSISFLPKFAYGGVRKWFRVGKFHDFVVDYGGQGGTEGWRVSGYYYYNGFTRPSFQMRGWHFGCKDWTDEYGNLLAVRTVGAAASTSDELSNTMPIPDNEGLTIRLYRREQPPSIIVDGYQLAAPFPLLGDEVNPDYIPGTANQMVESWIRTAMGVTINQKVYAWAQKNHDDYLVYDWTFINTGNIDLDDDIELPNQTLEGVYLLRGGLSFFPICYGYDNSLWNSAYGEHPYDTLRLVYAYDAIGKYADFDDFGVVDPATGFFKSPLWLGEAVLHCDSSPDNHSDNPAQPQMTGVENSEIFWERQEFGHAGPEDHAKVYDLMQYGFKWYDGTPYLQDIGEDVYPGTHHGLRMDEQGITYPRDFPWWNWSPTAFYSCGPFTMEPGDTIRIVWATVMGSITPETAWEKGREWLNGTCTWDGPNNLPPPWIEHPDIAPTENDRAKDSWICTGKDSLFRNTRNAYWNARNNYQIPVPPPAPSIEISSLPDRVLIEWGFESEDVADFAGYRVYRAVGKTDSTYTLIYECGQGTPNSLSHSYEDTTAGRGVAYFYYVAAFDDGTHPEVSDPVGANGIAESLESGKYLNRTTKAAYLTRPPGASLSDIRVVPNPYNVNARNLQYPGEPDKIMFLNLPSACDIRIYSESSDLIRIIEHRDGSGDHAWVTPEGEQFMSSSIGQLIVSGIYIAHIVELDFDTQDPTGNSVNVPFIIIR